ncbi:MAG TPA: YncE family protein, partial [Anaerolineae bacterium]|nr:YncE family protein [Anaerolineae bacterium]
TLTVVKALWPVSDPGQFIIDADGTTGPAGGHGTSASSSVFVGDSATFGETAAPGTDPVQYITTYSCTDGTSGSGSGSSLTMPDQDVTCTITNWRKPLKAYMPFILNVWPAPEMRHPKMADVNPQTGRVFVTSRDNDTLWALDGQTLDVIDVVPVCAEPFDVAVNQNTDKVYVTCFASGEVAVVDGSTLAVLSQVEVGYHPASLAVNPDTNRIYVAVHGSSRVAVIDGTTDTLAGVIDVHNGPFGIAVNRNLNRVYVGHRDSLSIVTIDGATDTLLHSQTVYPTPSRSVPYAMEYNEASQKLYVVYGPYIIPNKVWAYQATTSGLNPLTSIDVGNGGADGGGGIVANPTTNHIFVTNSAENSVTVIDGALDTVLSTIHHPGVFLQDPYGIVVDSTAGIVYVVNRSADNLSMFPDP